MKSIRNFILIVFVLAAMLVASAVICGCDEYDPQKLQGYTAQAQAMNDQVKQLTESIQPALDTLASGGVISDEQAAQVIKVNEEIGRIAPQLDTMIAAINNINYTGEKVDDTLATLTAINGATAAYNPYSGLINIGLLIITAIAGLFAKKKTSDAAAAKKITTEIVAGVSAVKDLVSDKAAFKTQMNAAQSVTTRATVAAIEEELKLK
jgi:outer membrane murein-binding lipoprotein Lpp